MKIHFFESFSLNEKKPIKTQLERQILLSFAVFPHIHSPGNIDQTY